MKLTPRSSVIFDMLTGPQQVKKFHALYETRSLPCSQQLIIVPVLIQMNPIHTLPSTF
jgi:hypothetical protein